jgi:1-acyl-sn-glycerol-3-phosphate acyltransferase
MLDELTFDFNYLLWICCIIVLLFLFLSFGRAELTLLTFAPMAIAFIWILGMMAIFDIRFNIINIILTTFIFGIGDDYSIFIMEGLIYEYAYGKKMLTSYKTAVILSAVTMFTGIGALIIARHPAMFSLAQVTIIGMIAVAVIAYTVAPFIFKWLTMAKGQKRRMPVTLWNLTKTAVSFLVFLIFSLALTLAGFLLLTIGRKSKVNKLRFHKCICSVFRILSKIMIEVPVKVLNEHKENFEKPGIIICNHQSHLDLMYTLMLSPKIICLTNEWVSKSPLYGWILRYADFYPVANGIEQSIKQLRTAIENGYSILVFPEGTRSEDCSIGRFHKGAFYLAEQLQVDIIPVVVHGIGHFFPKNEFMSRRGRVTIQILERIACGNELRTGKEYYEIAKAVRHFYQQAYQRLAAQCETVSYFTDLVKHNYIYKGAGIARAVRRSLKNNHCFEEAIAAMPDEGCYHISHCGYGEFPLLAALVKKRLQITASDPDEEKMLLAANCAAVPDNLKYTI